LKNPIFSLLLLPLVVTPLEAEHITMWPATHLSLVSHIANITMWPVMHVLLLLLAARSDIAKTIFSDARSVAGHIWGRAVTWDDRLELKINRKLNLPKS
jgi:hypothetical protein